MQSLTYNPEFRITIKDKLILIGDYSENVLRIAIALIQDIEDLQTLINSSYLRYQLIQYGRID